jgi:hypothetical protein
MLLIEIALQEVLLEVKNEINILIVYHVHAGGWTRVYEGEDVNKLHYKFANEKGN